jgi:hypothetical protein
MTMYSRGSCRLRASSEACQEVRFQYRNRLLLSENGFFWTENGVFGTENGFFCTENGFKTTLNRAAGASACARAPRPVREEVRFECVCPVKRCGFGVYIR